MIMHKSYSRCNPPLYVFSLSSETINFLDTSYKNYYELHKFNYLNWQVLGKHFA